MAEGFTASSLRFRPQRKCHSLLIPWRGHDHHSWPQYKTPGREGKRRQGNRAWDVTVAELSHRDPSCKLEKRRWEQRPWVSHVLLATTGWTQCHRETQHCGGAAERGDDSSLRSLLADTPHVASFCAAGSSSDGVPRVPASFHLQDAASFCLHVRCQTD